jgi:hypothetical protein
MIRLRLPYREPQYATSSRLEGAPEREPTAAEG